jgi:AbrB family looped-hinge helix DNA binding protein
MAEITISSKNQVVIPREARKVLGFKSGDKLLSVVRDGYLILVLKPKSYEKAIRGLGKGMYPKNYLEKERASWE